MKLSLLAILAFAVALNAPAADTNILGRAYPIQPSMWEVMGATGRGNDSTSDIETKLMQFFKTMGVPFPEGSRIRRCGDLLVIWNTPENLGRFDRVMNAHEVPSRIEIDYSLVALPFGDLDTAARKSGRAAATAEDVRALWRGGTGRLVSTSKVLARSGVNAQVRGVAEIIYPTEFERTEVRESEHARYHPAHPPGAFEMREVGAIWNVTPTVGPDGRTIDLSVMQEAASLEGLDDLGPARTTDGKTAAIHLRQPRFRSRNLTTSVVLWDGGTVVLGGFRGEDGKETTYAFISARLVNPAGRPVNANSATPRSP